ncbi:MAG: glucokinase [Gemmatimonadales bacterium]|nr:glucokinase [Gemmatimonadales bacterium]
MSHQVLAGDIGGTNARLAVVEVGGSAKARIVHEARYRSSAAPGLAPIVARYLGETGAKPEVACFGIACPVLDGDCRAPNLPWTVDGRALAREIGIPRTTIINDFAAVGHGIESLSPDEVKVLQEGTVVSGGPVALIGAGTGLGQGYLLREGGQYVVHPSEGGHADFSPTNALERDLLAFLAPDFGRVSWERILSGPGLANIYRFLKTTGAAEEQATVRDEIADGDPAPVITGHGLAGTDELSVKTLELFAGAYGTAAGNLALTVLASGGVYICGGIAPKIVRRLASGVFMEAFRNKGRLSAVLARMPVRVILTDDVALYGAAAVAARTLMDGS